MDLGLRDKVVVVAASSQGLGRATALAFAAEGARVVINGRHEDSLQETLRDIRDQTGTEVEAITADLSDAEGCGRLIEGAVERFDAIDVLVTNAGGPPSKPFDQLRDEDWYAAFDLTLLSAVRLIRAALPHLRQSHGSIVNLTSISVKEPIPGLVLSNSIRPGVVGLGKTLADDLAPAGVRVNDVAPGLIWTERQKYLTSVRAQNQGISVEQVMHQTEAGIPMRHYGAPEDVAHAVVFLCSAAAGYITGVTLLVDGGMYKGLM